MCGLLEIDFSDPTVAAANRFMAATWHLFFGNDAHRAIAPATEAVELDPACAMAHVMATFGAMFVGRAQEAVLAATAAQGLACDASEEVFCLIALGSALLDAGHVDRADLVADAFIAWAEDLQYPTATGMAYHLKGRTLAELDGAAARECFERGLAIVREEIRGCWIVDTNLEREMGPLVHRTSPADAPEWALASLRESVRHNETGNLLTALAYAAIVVADGGLDEVAARASPRTSSERSVRCVPRPATTAAPRRTGRRESRVNRRSGFSGGLPFGTRVVVETGEFTCHRHRRSSWPIRNGSRR